MQTVAGTPIEQPIKLLATEDSAPGACIELSNYDVTVQPGL